MTFQSAGKPRRPCHYHDKGIMPMIGRNAAIAEMGEHRHELHGPIAFWLFTKLAVVGLLVLGHGICGMLILRSERQAGHSPSRGTRVMAGVVGLASVLWLSTIAWLVLAKPF